MKESTNGESGGDGQERPGHVREFLAFLVHKKKWWLVPIVLALIFIAALVVVSGSTEAPFIYTPLP